MELGASFEGVVLRLKENALVTPELFNYLYRVVINKKKNREILNDFFESEWLLNLDIDECRYYYKFFIQIRNLFLEGLLTTRSVAAFTNLEYGEASRVCSYWEGECIESEATK